MARAGDKKTLMAGGRVVAMAGVMTVALAVGSLASVAQAVPTSTTTTAKPGPTAPGSSSPAPPASPPTTVPPWDATPTGAPTPGTAPAPPPAPGAPTSPATSGASGFDAASSVPIDAETTPTKVVYANPDGTKTAKISQAPVRFKDSAGKWTDFDLSLVARPDGSLGAKAAPQAATLSKRADGGAATVQTSAGPVVLRHPGAAPAVAAVGTLDATYAKALAGRDLKVALRPDGFEESVILADAAAPTSYRDEFDVPAGVTVRDAKGGVELVDKGGDVIGSYGAGFAYDATLPGGGSPTPVSVRTVSQVGNVAVLDVAIADPAWLSAPGRSFPVTIDPVWTTTTSSSAGGRDSLIASGPYANTSYSGVIYDYAGQSSGNSYRSLLNFNVSSLAGATVTAASLNLYNNSTGSIHSCVAKPLTVYGLGGAFAETTTWNTQPALDGGPALSTISFANQPSPNSVGANCPSNWVSMPITSIVQNWVNGATNYGLELRGDETDANGLQALFSGETGAPPYVSVTLNDRVPNPPTNVVATPNANGSIGVTWTASTPNGGSAIDYYLVYALNPDLTYAGSYAFVYPPAANVATMNGLDRSRTYVFGVYPHNAAGYAFAASAPVTTVADPLAGAGDEPWFSYDSFGLNDRLGAKVNLGTGNLVVSGADLNLPVVGGARSVARTYNSLAKDASSALFGYGWRFSEAPDRRLEIQYDGSARYNSPSGNATVFGNGVPQTSPNTLSTAPGIDATLIHNADGTYTLTFHASQEKLTFRSDGLLTADADRYGNTITYTYGTGWETTIAGTAGSSPGNTVNIAYAGPGGKVSALTQTADGVTRTVGYTYDSAGNLWKVNDANGGQTTFLYDSAHRLTSIAGPGTGLVAQTTTFGYDAANRVTSVTRVIPGGPTPSPATTTPPRGHTKVTDPDGHPPVDLSVDSLGRVTAATDPKNPPPPNTPPAIQISYINATNPTANTDNKVQTSRNASGGTSTYTWGANAGESLTVAADPIGATSGANFPNPGALAWSPDWVSDTLGTMTAIGYNGAVPDPRTVQNTTSADFGTTLYNTDGTVSSSTDPNNVSTTLLQALLQDTTKSTRYAYFATHQLQTITPPSGTSLGNQSFTYDGAGRLKTATSGKGVVTTLTYDNLDRIVNQTFSDGTHAIATGYDANGNAISRTDASGATSWVYDAANRLKTKTLPGGAVLGYAYDPAGNMISSTDAGATTAYGYDKVNELDQITEPPPSNRTDVFAYDADHRLTDTWTATNTGVTYDASGNTVVAPTGFASHIHRTYDTAGNLTEIRTTAASSDANASRLADLSYAYIVPSGTSCTGATVGKVTDKRQRVTDQLSTKTTDYCDDSSGRLTSAVTSGGPTYTYGYDKDSNRVTDAAGTHNFNAANQLIDTGTTYDADGNLTVSGAFPTLTYNGIDQTMAITPAGQAAVPFTYAGAGQAERTSAGTTTAQNGALGVQTETTGGATTSYVSGPGGLLVERTPGGDFYFYFDGLGSVIGLVDATTGLQRAAYTYDPYGSNATATGVNGALPANPWRFAGGYLDAATGLYHLGARYYDTSAGRWTQDDPLGGGYTYGASDPLNNVDPSGFKSHKPLPDLEVECGYDAPNDVFYGDKCLHYRTAKANNDSSIYYDFVNTGRRYDQPKISRIPFPSYNDFCRYATNTAISTVGKTGAAAGAAIGLAAGSVAGPVTAAGGLALGGEIGAYAQGAALGYQTSCLPAS